MVAIKRDVIALRVDAGAFGGVGNAVIAVLLFKIVVEIIIRFVRGLHNGIINARAVNGNPAYHVGVLIEQQSVLVIYRPFG